MLLLWLFTTLAAGVAAVKAGHHSAACLLAALAFPGLPTQLMQFGRLREKVDNQFVEWGM